MSTEMIDTLKTAGSGVSAWTVINLGILPELVSVCVGVVTTIYIIIKIFKEIK